AALLDRDLATHGRERRPRSTGRVARGADARGRRRRGRQDGADLGVPLLARGFHRLAEGEDVPEVRVVRPVRPDADAVGGAGGGLPVAVRPRAGRRARPPERVAGPRPLVAGRTRGAAPRPSGGEAGEEARGPPRAAGPRQGHVLPDTLRGDTDAVV